MNGLVDDKTFRQVFLGEGLEPLTNELIDELVRVQKMPKKDLLKFQKQGAQYSRPRNSIVFPLVYEGF